METMMKIVTGTRNENGVLTVQFTLHEMADYVVLDNGHASIPVQKEAFLAAMRKFLGHSEKNDER